MQFHWFTCSFVDMHKKMFRKLNKEEKSLSLKAKIVSIADDSRKKNGFVDSIHKLKWVKSYERVFFIAIFLVGCHGLWNVFYCFILRGAVLWYMIDKRVDGAPHISCWMLCVVFKWISIFFLSFFLFSVKECAVFHALFATLRLIPSLSLHFFFTCVTFRTLCQAHFDLKITKENGHISINHVANVIYFMASMRIIIFLNPHIFAWCKNKICFWDFFFSSRHFRES